MQLGKSRGQLLVAPERMKRRDQGGNDAQLWMCLVVKVKSNAVNNICAWTDPGKAERAENQMPAERVPPYSYRDRRALPQDRYPLPAFLTGNLRHHPLLWL